MKKLLFAGLICTSLSLAACGATVAMTPALEDSLKNPLYAEQYWEDLTDRMATLLIEKEYAEGTDKHAYVDSIREQALTQAQAATKKRMAGISGQFTSNLEHTQGFALFVDGSVYLSPSFITYPGPSLHVYLTTAVDPREAKFPDESAVDIGLLKSPYGAQEFALPTGAKTEGLRTVVLYDDKLERIYAFAQLAK